MWAVIWGAEGWEDSEEYGKAQAEWFEPVLDVPHGIPCAETFRRVVSRVDTDAVTRCCISWSEALRDISPGDWVAIDGPTLRHAFARGASTAAMHLVSAWAHANRLVLGQLTGEDPSNEITAIPQRVPL